MDRPGKCAHGRTADELCGELLKAQGDAASIRRASKRVLAAFDDWYDGQKLPAAVENALVALRNRVRK